LSKQIYYIIHSKTAKEYWTNKSKTIPEALDYVHWDIVGQALKSLPRSRRVFVTKFCVGMLGVGKFMCRWKKWTHNKFPRCGEFEDASHVISCKAPTVDELWHLAVDSLQQWMESVLTEPQVAETIISELKNWRNPSHALVRPPTPMPDILAHTQQGDIGWNLALEGWLATEWEVTQQSHYALINSRKTGHRWMASFIHRCWQIIWVLWEHRNGVLHQQQNLATQLNSKRVDDKVRALYSKALQFLLISPDKHLVKHTMQRLLHYPDRYKAEWIRVTAIAIRSAKCRRNSHWRSLRKMQDTLWYWLQSGKRANSITGLRGRN
jgi:hypothetical protein